MQQSVEVNPLVVSHQDEILALDCKMSFDNNAMFRRDEIAELRDKTQEKFKMKFMLLTEE